MLKPKRHKPNMYELNYINYIKHYFFFIIIQSGISFHTCTPYNLLFTYESLQLYVIIFVGVMGLALCNIPSLLHLQKGPQ